MQKPFEEATFALKVNINMNSKINNLNQLFKKFLYLIYLYINFKISESTVIPHIKVELCLTAVFIFFKVFFIK